MNITVIKWHDVNPYKPYPEASILFIDDSGNVHCGINAGNKVISSGIAKKITETTTSDSLKTYRGEYEVVLTTYNWSQIRYWCYTNEIETEFAE